jgi:hypothetical protein
MLLERPLDAAAFAFRRRNPQTVSSAFARDEAAANFELPARTVGQVDVCAKAILHSENLAVGLQPDHDPRPAAITSPALFKPHVLAAGRKIERLGSCDCAEVAPFA